MAEPAKSFGELLAAHRHRRDLSQLALALQTSVSTRHISFLESGRSNPSRAMVLRLARGLDVDTKMRSEMLQSAGYAVPRRAATPVAAAQAMAVQASVIDCAIGIQEAVTVAAAAEILRGVLSRYGLEWFYAGTLTVSESGQHFEIGMLPGGAPPLAWLAHYGERRFRSQDPLVRATLVRNRPFFWDEVRRSAGPNPASSAAIFAEARAFRVCNGLVTPLHHVDGTVSAVSAMGERVDSGVAVKHEAAMVCYAFLERFEQWRAAGVGLVEEPKLCPDAASILSWLAAGRTAEWIAARTHHTLERLQQRVEGICRSLGTRDPLQAVLRARRYRLMEF